MRSGTFSVSCSRASTIVRGAKLGVVKVRNSCSTMVWRWRRRRTSFCLLKCVLNYENNTKDGKCYSTEEKLNVRTQMLNNGHAFADDETSSHDHDGCDKDDGSSHAETQRGIGGENAPKYQRR